MYMTQGRTAEDKMDLSTAASAYSRAHDAARTTGEESIAWRCLSRVESLSDEHRGFI